MEIQDKRPFGINDAVLESYDIITSLDINLSIETINPPKIHSHTFNILEVTGGEGVTEDLKKHDQSE